MWPCEYAVRKQDPIDPLKGSQDFSRSSDQALRTTGMTLRRQGFDFWKTWVWIQAPPVTSTWPGKLFILLKPQHHYLTGLLGGLIEILSTYSILSVVSDTWYKSHSYYFLILIITDIHEISAAKDPMRRLYRFFGGLFHRFINIYLCLCWPRGKHLKYLLTIAFPLSTLQTSDN